MDIENPTSVIASATNAVSQAISFAAEKLGPVATKTVEVVAKQVHVDLWTNGLLALLFAVIAAIFGKICFAAGKKCQTFGKTYETDTYEPISIISGILSVIFILLTAGFTVYICCTAPTVIFNTEYATAAKVCELLSLLKSQ